jgi:hypothetical protein
MTKAALGRGRNCHMSLISPGLAVLAFLVAHPCWAVGNSADDSTSSGATKVAAQAGTLRFVNYRSPAGVSARILDGDQPVFEGIGEKKALLLIQPTGRSAVCSRCSAQHPIQ